MSDTISDPAQHPAVLPCDGFVPTPPPSVARLTAALVTVLGPMPGVGGAESPTAEALRVAAVMLEDVGAPDWGEAMNVRADEIGAVIVDIFGSYQGLLDAMVTT